MKYIKVFEAKKNTEFHKNEIVLRPSAYSHSLHLLLQNVNDNDVWIEEFHIGVIGRNVNDTDYASLVFNTENEGIAKFRNGTFRHLNEFEKDLVYNSIRNNQYAMYIDKIKKLTGIDLREIKDYKDWLLEQDAKKYNL